MRRIYLITLLSFLCIGAFAQRDFGLHSMQNTFQKRYLNPAYQPDSKLHIGLPIISSTSTYAYNTGFKLGGIFDFNDETNDVNTQELVKGLQPLNTLGYGINTDILSLGAASGKNYISLSSRFRADINFNYPGDLMRLFLEGNGGDLLGKRINLDGFGMDVNVFSEIGLGFSRHINDKLSVGVTAKYLIGLLNVTTERSQLGLTTNEEDFSLSLDGALDLRLSGIDIDGLRNGGSDSTLQAATESIGSNSGFGVDLGANYRVNNKITLGAAILDLGAISWSQENSTIYQTNDVDFEYSGLDYDDFVSSDTENDDPLGELLDSLQNALEPDKRKEGYTSSLNTQFVLTGGYNLTQKTEVGIMYRNFSKQKSGASSVTAYVATDLKRWLSATISASYLNRSIGNVGMGLMLKGGPIQFYVMADNLLALANPESTKNVHTRFGLNLVFGKRKMATPGGEIQDGTPADSSATVPATEKVKKKKEKKAKKKKVTAEDEASELDYLTPAELEKQDQKEDQKMLPAPDAKPEKVKKVKEKKTKKKKKDDEDFDNWNKPNEG